jgi:hypothetical protein
VTAELVVQGVQGAQGVLGTLGTLGVGWLGGALSWALLGRLREHREEPAGLADWLLWAYLVDEGVVLGKDGSLLAGWSYRGPDSSAATAEDLGALSAHVSQALLPFGNGWMVHWNAVRHAAPGYAPPGAFPDAVTALIDEERRRTYEATAAHFETDTFVTLAYLPPPDLYSQLARVFVQGEGSKGASAPGRAPTSMRAVTDTNRLLVEQLRRLMQHVERQESWRSTRPGELWRGLLRLCAKTAESMRHLGAKRRSVASSLSAQGVAPLLAPLPRPGVRAGTHAWCRRADEERWARAVDPAYTEA